MQILRIIRYITRISSTPPPLCPPNRIGRRRSITPTILEALGDHLLDKPSLYLDDSAIFLWDEFQMLVTASSIRKALVSKGWPGNTAQQKAKEQNAELRESQQIAKPASPICTLLLILLPTAKTSLKKGV
jgi:hypothetical protein